MFRKAVHKDSWKIPRRNGPLGNVLLILLFVQMVFLDQSSTAYRANSILNIISLSETLSSC